MTQDTPASDIQETGWIKRLPPDYRPYAILARLDRPIGIWLLLLPSLWGILLAGTYHKTSFSLATLWAIVLFSLGSVVMRGAGCIINDLWDRTFDAQVSRTQNRPLASGVLSTTQALALLSALLMLGFCILLLLNGTTMILGLFTIPLIVLYPFMKRVTYWPQVILGMTFNFGALMGWTAITDQFEFPAFLLYLGGICWTLGYDTIYAHQDKEDDALLGLKSTALKFGTDSKMWVIRFYTGLWVCISLALLISQPENAVIASIGLLATAGHLIWQVRAWNPESPESALKIFQSNRTVGWIILITFLLCRI